MKLHSLKFFISLFSILFLIVPSGAFLSSEEVEILSPQIVSVTSGGFWDTHEFSGHYRVLVSLPTRCSHKQNVANGQRYRTEC